MKSSMLLLLLSLFVSCSTMGNKNNSHHFQEDHLFWTKQDKSMTLDHKRASTIFDWALKHIKEHKMEISKVTKSIKQHQKELKALRKQKSSTPKSKKMQLEFENKHKQLKKEYNHYLSEHSRLMDIVSRLESLKTESQK